MRRPVFHAFFRIHERSIVRGSGGRKECSSVENPKTKAGVADPELGKGTDRTFPQLLRLPKRVWLRR